MMFANDITIAIRSAVPKLAISKEDPIILSVSTNVIALMTNRKRPKENIVTGSVKIMRMGLTKIFKIDSITLAATAAPKLDT